MRAPLVWRFFFPPGRVVVVRTDLDPAATQDRLRASLTPARWLALPPVGSVVGRIQEGRLTAWVYRGRNAWRPVLKAQVEPEARGRSVIRGSIGSSTAVGAFSLVWLVGALTLTGVLVVAAVAGFISGHPTIRGGDGAFLPTSAGLLISIGAFLVFGGFGIGLPLLARRLAASDPDRLIAFLVAATDGEVIER